MLPRLIDQVLVVYNKVRDELLPTPTKSHYLFNLRDIAKVFQGICLASVKVIVEPVQTNYFINIRPTWSDSGTTRTCGSSTTV